VVTPTPDLVIARVGIDHPDALALIAEVQAEYVVRYGGPDETPLDPSMFLDPLGAFFVGYRGGTPVMMGAWRRRTDVEALGTMQTAEIKRMYVASGQRGLGLARVMLGHLERTAAAAGVVAAILETGLRQPEAIALYESSGYQPIASFGYYRDAPLSRCFGKRLS